MLHVLDHLFFQPPLFSFWRDTHTHKKERGEKEEETSKYLRMRQEGLYFAFDVCLLVICLCLPSSRTNGLPDEPLFLVS